MELDSLYRMKRAQARGVGNLTVEISREARTCLAKSQGNPHGTSRGFAARHNIKKKWIWIKMFFTCKCGNLVHLTLRDPRNTSVDQICFLCYKKLQQEGRQMLMKDVLFKLRDETDKLRSRSGNGDIAEELTKLALALEGRELASAMGGIQKEPDLRGFWCGMGFHKWTKWVACDSSGDTAAKLKLFQVCSCVKCDGRKIVAAT